MSAENETEANDAVPSVDLVAHLAALSADRERLASENGELQDLIKRRQADFENFRRRAERDRSEFLQFAGMELVRELLPVLDDFARALKVEGASPDYTRGIELIYNRLYDLLKKMGLEPIDTTGQKFDPNLHQAVDRVETEDEEDHQILEEYQKGYKFKGKLLRPSMVKVAVCPS